jgi:Tol biopolymer transport system component
MEFVPGRTLDRAIPKRGLRLNEALDYAVQIADALAAAHAAGIVHRDLKPANVIVTEQGRIKVLDFGLAKLMERQGLSAGDDGQTLTRPAPVTGEGTIVGTVAYMSPEQAEAKAVDARSDIFSFGAVLYEMVTGQRAFQGDSPLSTLTAVLREDPKPISNISAGVPRDLDRLITRCLRKIPERRWQSMADVKVALQELKEESESGAVAVSAPVVHRAYRVWPILAALAVAVVAAVAGMVVWRNRDRTRDISAIASAPIPLTAYSGREQQASFSPDGNSVAFTWNGEKEDNWDIWVKLIGEGSPQQLTTDPAIDFSPAWSPDGRTIAFGRVRKDRLVIVVVPSRDGPERELQEFTRFRNLGMGQLLSWSPDSRILVVSASPSSGEAALLTALNVTTGETRAITSASADSIGLDSLPSISPDGSALAFARLRPGMNSGRLHVQPLSAGFVPVGEPRPIDADGVFYNGIAWSPSGRDLIVSSGNTGAGIWRIPVRTPDTGERLSPPGDDCRQPAVAAQGRLAFTRTTWDENNYRAALTGRGRSAGNPVSLIGSTRSEQNARFSPDGTRVVFESHRSGTQELWIADPDGRNALPLTSFNGRVGGTPTWSPDGKSIAFDLRDPDRGSDIHVVSSRGGAARRLTNHPGDDAVPGWSRDGKWIYFGSTRSGRVQIWKVAPEGGEPTPVTRNGGGLAKESSDGRFLYYSRTDTAPATIWRVPTSGGEEVRMIDRLANYHNFAVAREGIYFQSTPQDTPLGHVPLFSPFTQSEYAIDFLDFATGRVNHTLKVPRPSARGLDVSPDGRTLLFATMDSLSQDLMLVENFK